MSIFQDETGTRLDRMARASAEPVLDSLKMFQQKGISSYSGVTKTSFFGVYGCSKILP